MPGTGDALTKITEFNHRLVLPLFEEIQGSRRMAAKNRVLRIAEGFSTGHPMADDALLGLHATRRGLPDLATTPAHERQGEWVGHTLILIEPQAMRIDQRHTLAGYFFSSVVFRIEPGERVLASPWVLYWMRFNDRMHAFEHRYEKDVPKSPIEDLARQHLLEHAVNAIGYFDSHAFSIDRPW